MPSRVTRTNAVLGTIAALALAGTAAAASTGTPRPPETAAVSVTVVATTEPSPSTATTASTAATATTEPPTPVDVKPAAEPSSTPSVAPTTAPRPAPSSPTAASEATWAVTKVVDGDTIWVSRDGISRKIRFIGLDTPETGQCGFAEARAALRRVIGGQRVTLTSGARDDVDRYGRLLRYVDVGGVDSGLRLIQQGYAVARYDSRDGYGRHSRQSSYVQADAASPRAACAAPADTTTSGSSGGSGSTTTTPAPGRTPAPVAAPIPPSATGWPLAGDRYPCPRSAPVKGNESSMIAHSPGQQSYLITSPERCFTSLSQAASAGYRPAKR